MLNKILFIFAVFMSASMAGEHKKFDRDFSKIQSLKASILTDEGEILIELNYAKAPNTVANFEFLAKSGYYNGTSFHRVIQGFMTQGGDSTGTGRGGPGYTIADEKNDLKHEIGVISMANTGAPHTGGSQFFLTHMPQPHLDGRHTVFGKVVKGLDVITLIEQGDRLIQVKILEEKSE